MTRRILFIILWALVVLGVIALLWYFLFNRTPAAPAGNGSFGTSQNRTDGSASSGSNASNGQTALGSNTSAGGVSGGTNTQIPLPTYTTGDASSFSTSTSSDFVSSDSIPDTTWIGGGSAGTGGGAVKSFTPTPINTINNVNISGTPYIGGTGGDSGTSGSGGLGLGGELAGAGIAGAVTCAAVFLPASNPATASALALATGAAVAAVPVADAASLVNVQVQTSDQNTKFLDCITRTIARIAIDQITASTVDWINSGFNGQPTFVQDYQQFFSNVADQSAGAFLQSSPDLAFLCSPFQLQVKIAVAQSYAHRNTGPTAQNSCTLSGAVDNVQAFLQNGFSSGGWGGLLAFTTDSNNNPYGAFLNAQVSLNNKIVLDTGNAARQISPSGFLNQQKCDLVPGPNGIPEKENCKIVTPGETIAASANKLLGNSIDSLDLATNFDQIISALVQQLMTKTLYSGLSSLSGSGGYQSDFSSAQDSQAAVAAQTLLTQLQGAVQLAQQYGSTQQGDIADIQNAQNQSTSLENCWISVASSTNATSAQQTQAQNSATAADSQVQALEAQVTQHNTEITRANTAIAQIQQLQTSALAAASLADVTAVSNQLSAAQAQGTLITQTDVSGALQDRTTLQAQMSTLNENTTTSLNQCYASQQ